MSETKGKDNKNIIEGKAVERYLYRLETLKEFHKLFTYNIGDDRAIVIIGGAFLETILEHILIEFLAEDEKEVDMLLRPDRPLGSYANKVRMIYCLGLMENKIMKDLKLIGKIRNKFAHNLSASFEDSDIKSWCMALKWHSDYFFIDDSPRETTTRDYYQISVNTIISNLNGVADMARNEKRVVLNNYLKS